jgi:hypothetical protein
MSDCARCGSQQDPGARYCGACGEPVASTRPDVHAGDGGSTAPNAPRFERVGGDTARAGRVYSPSGPGRAASSVRRGGELPFFEALFDFDFDDFITLRFLKVIYGLMLLAVVAVSVLFAIGCVSAGGKAGPVLAVILTPIGALFWAVMARVAVEAIAVFFRIHDHTEAMARSVPPAAAATAQPRAGSLAAP